MLKLNLKSGILLLIAVAIVTVVSFTPVLTPTPVAEARSCESPWSYYNARAVSTWSSCPWDFGCWIKPGPNGRQTCCVRTCADKQDRYGFCGTDCWDNCNVCGGCC